eukprot:2614677-Pyramimonas_sp.AAC.1
MRIVGSSLTSSGVRYIPTSCSLWTCDAAVRQELAFRTVHVGQLYAGSSHFIAIAVYTTNSLQPPGAFCLGWVNRIDRADGRLNPKLPTLHVCSFLGDGDAALKLSDQLLADGAAPDFYLI